MAKKSRRGRTVYNKILLPYKEDNNIFNDLRRCPRPIILRANGALITVATPSDALCYLYTINLSFPKKKGTKKNRENYLRQVELIFQHQDQICRWISMMEYDRTEQPHTVNVSWKTADQKNIINVAFGASASTNRKYKREVCRIRRENDRYLLPRDQYGNVIPELEKWEFGNCSETNAWTCLCQWRSDLPIKSRTITVYDRITKDPCKNCKAIQNWLTD